MRIVKDAVLPVFLPAIQNDFAARMKWSVTEDYASANHNPVISGPVALSAGPGESVSIKTRVSDPDKNAVSLSWAQYKVGSYQGELSLMGADSDNVSFIVPEDAKAGDTIHLVLTAEDNGEPVLTRYHRVIITIK